LRNDVEDCAGNAQDLGYRRITQLYNGKIICAYYFSSEQYIENHVAASIWRGWPSSQGRGLPGLCVNNFVNGPGNAAGAMRILPVLTQFHGNLTSCLSTNDGVLRKKFISQS